MKKIFFVQLMLLLFCCTCAQKNSSIKSNYILEYNECVNKNSSIIKSNLIKLFGEDWHNKKLNKDNKIHFTIILDSLGSFKKLINYKADMMSKDEFDLFYSCLSKNRFCLFNGDVHMSDREYILYGKNEYIFSYVYPKKN